ncbi:MAG: hypothetical protein HC888_15040 [Candidatus Competibacteraceae bacterium]|nr:hypothetical protein [Candidatus Competibacteraceae bacterium]
MASSGQSRAARAHGDGTYRQQGQHHQRVARAASRSGVVHHATRKQRLHAAPADHVHVPAAQRGVQDQDICVDPLVHRREAHRDRAALHGFQGEVQHITGLKDVAQEEHAGYRDRRATHIDELKGDLGRLPHPDVLEVHAIGCLRRDAEIALKLFLAFFIPLALAFNVALTVTFTFALTFPLAFAREFHLAPMVSVPASRGNSSGVSNSPGSSTGPSQPRNV